MRFGKSGAGKSSDGADTLRWKQKYFDSLDELEQSQSSLQDKVDVLRRGLVSVSLAGDGLDNSLDLELTQLRELLRGRNQKSDATLRQLLEKIETTILSLDSGRQQSATAAQKVISGIIAEILSSKLNLSRPLRQDLKRFNKQLGQKKQDNRHQLDSLLGFFPLISPIIAELTGAEDEEENDKSSMFHRLFNSEKQTHSNQDDAEPVTATISSQDEAPDPAPAVQVEVVDASTLSPDSILEGVCDDVELTSIDDDDSGLDSEKRLEIVHDIQDFLYRLLDNIATSGRQKSDILDLQQRVLTLREPETREVLEKTLAILIQAYNDEREEFKEFLNAANQALGQLSAFVTQTRDHESQSKHQDEKLDKNVRSQLDGIQTSVDKANDLAILKQEVRTRLDHIVESMDEFKSVKQKQESGFAQQIETLVEKIDSMEKESKQIRKHLEAQETVLQKDALTELSNRAAYNTKIEEEFTLWQSRGEQLCLCMADVDYFKKINDNHGHASGDKVLKTIAKELETRTRGSDFVARYGGEEFILIMPQTSVENAFKAIDKIRLAVSEIPFSCKGNNIQVTMSFGITEFARNDDISKAFERADQALYQAKHEGRNRCCVITI